ncbi:MAG: phosphoheptose isomerase, partial [Spirosoma sp.]|nr:phosphoheptose isomerase [Spirosoma sp.]
LGRGSSPPEGNEGSSTDWQRRGQLAGLADVEIRVQHLGFADRIQEVHGKIIHILILLIETLTADSTNGTEYQPE